MAPNISFWAYMIASQSIPYPFGALWGSVRQRKDLAAVYAEQQYRGRVLPNRPILKPTREDYHIVRLTNASFDSRFAITAY